LTGGPVPFLLSLQLLCRLVSNMQYVTVIETMYMEALHCLNFEPGYFIDYA